MPTETAGFGLATAEAAVWVDPLAAAAAGEAARPIAIVASMAVPAPTAASLRASPDFMRGCSVSLGSECAPETVAAPTPAVPGPTAKPR
ncbi:hypothetical protein GCM10017600_49990 [Streptosporangium carneum]|uniref:Uncharacterized protein n=1 Tax=Streptosporangium carneum TaxID=47481 RepID=A0A9W6MEX9_9ACTN|nr:hypothetical protein GCM10017600_49990 [Streptosporangium carneum]